MQAQVVARYFQVTEQCLAAGNLTAADLLCRIVLAAEPRQIVAFNFLGIIAAQLGLFEQARAHFEQSVALGYDAARNNLATLEALGASTSPVDAPAPAGVDRFILIKPWGQGFWSEVTHVLGGLLLAEITERIPVVHWSGKSLYGGSAEDDGFKAFFDPVSAITLRELSRLRALDIYPQRWTLASLSSDFPTVLPASDFAGATAAALALLGRRERLVVADYHLSVAELAPWLPTAHPLHGQTIEAIFRYLIDKYLRPVPSIALECQSFFAQHLAGTPSVAIHLRGSDKSFEDPAIVASNNEALGRLAQLPADTKIFGMTDDRRYADYLAATYGDRLVMIDSERTSQNVGVHFVENGDRKRKGLEIMRDTYIGIQADRFIGCGSSNVAAMAAVLREWPKDRCVIIGASYITALDVRLCLHLPGEILGFLSAA